MTKDGIASGFAFGYDPTGRSAFLYELKSIEYLYFANMG
jgi:hypothetical protein